MPLQRFARDNATLNINVCNNNNNNDNNKNWHNGRLRCSSCLSYHGVCRVTVTPRGCTDVARASSRTSIHGSNTFVWFSLDCLQDETYSPPVDNIWYLSGGWGKIVLTILCGIVYQYRAERYAHMCEWSLLLVVRWSFHLHFAYFFLFELVSFCSLLPLRAKQ